jgi:hypothetical protein
MLVLKKHQSTKKNSMVIYRPLPFILNNRKWLIKFLQQALQGAISIPNSKSS